MLKANKSDAPIGLLPLSATANDVRGVVQYLKKRPEGVTLGEAVDALKKQVFESSKIVAYETLGLIMKSGDRLKLDALGWRLARILEPESQVFRSMLSQIEPYRAVLDWARGQKLDYLIHQDVADYWRNNYPEALGINTPKMTESSVICFFQLCQAASLGTHIIGKKGQPTRLRLDRDELVAYINADPFIHLETPSEQTLQREITGQNATPGNASHNHGVTAPWSLNHGKARVFISFGGDGELARQLHSALDLADIEAHISERAETGRESLLPPGSVELMRRCNSSVIIIGKDDYRENAAGECLLEETLQIEIGAALVLYDRRVLLLWREQVDVPLNLNGMRHCHLNGDAMTWDEGVQLVRAVKTLSRPSDQD
jgi:hypothetical protein